MTQPTGEEPQDAPAGQPWTPWPQAPGDVSPSAGLPVGAGAPQHPGASPADPQRSGAAVAQSHDADSGAERGVRPTGARAALSAPTGPNWMLAVVGLLLLLAAGGQLAYLLGFRPDGDLQVGPRALIATGALLLLVGAVGLVGRRTGGANRRRQRATRRR